MDYNNIVLAKQVLRSWTSIGANIQESIWSYSPKELIFKLSIAYKESRETQYWLLLLNKSEIVTEADFKVLNQKCDELSSILYSIIKKHKQ